ncbi:DUF177 domain-containing protein [Planktotalea sp.]|uniref:YceD family protein n=1 Tax=Planktotalea sp. TaxID=2029877 RepID=UPI0035C7FB05
MTDTPAFPEFVLDIATLAQRKRSVFEYRLDAAQLSTLKDELGLTSLRKVVFSGELTPAGKHDFALKAALGATAVQPCTITLEPVTTRIDEDVERRFVADMAKHTARDTEEEDEFGGTAMLEDDTLEPLGREVDLWRVMSEALALALPDYPRAEGAELGTMRVTEPGKEALGEDDLKPFAGLADLKSKLEGKP